MTITYSQRIITLVLFNVYITFIKQFLLYSISRCLHADLLTSSTLEYRKNGKGGGVRIGEGSWKNQNILFQIQTRVLHFFYSTSFTYIVYYPVVLALNAAIPY